MSNLPEVFRRSLTVNLRRPEKQDGIFSLKLYTNSQTNYLSNRRASTALTKQTLPRTASRTGNSTSRKSYWSTRNSFGVNDVNNIEQDQQQETLMNTALKLQFYVKQTQKTLLETKQNELSLKNELKELNCKHERQMDEIQNKCRRFFIDLRQLLSVCRRETGTQTKINSKDISTLAAEFNESEYVMLQLDKYTKLMKTNLIGEQNN